MNVLSKTDFQSLIDLCNEADNEIAKWKAVCSGLKTELVHMVEKLGDDGVTIKGVYKPNSDKSYIKKVRE